MSTPLHVVCNSIFGNFYFFVVLLFMAGKGELLQVVKVPYPKNRFLVTSGHFSQRIGFSQGRVLQMLFLVGTSR